MTTKADRWQASSSFGWIDVDRDEAKRVRELLGLFKAPEAIDPHGILPLQIALSDRLFPGMSTQHTRARYVFFAAWHAQRLGSDNSRRSPLESLRLDELDLMRSLLESEDRDGVFGKRSREKTKTLPTAVYWSAIQRWGMIPGDLTVADVRPRMRQAVARTASWQFSDDAHTAAPMTGVLPADFPTAPIGFPAKNQSLAMTVEESDYFLERVMASCPDSFLAVVIKRPHLAAGVWPWTEDPTAGGQALIDARCFSELIHPARLLYAKLLVDDARRLGTSFDDLDAAIESDFDQWRAECDGRQSDLQEWVSARLPQLLNDPKIRLSRVRRDFISSALNTAALNPDGCLDSADLGQRVRRIELAVKKRPNARLAGGEPFRRWMKQPSRIASRRLDYRWPNVRQFLVDMDVA